VQVHTPVWLVVLADLVGVDASIWSAIGAASGVIGARAVYETDRHRGLQLTSVRASG
jgi:hypothetical protein